MQRAGSVVTITGILHASTVHDGAVTAHLYPDNGGPPLLIADNNLHRQDIVAALDDIVTVSGTLRCGPDGAQSLDLDHVGTVLAPLPSPGPGPHGTPTDTILILDRN